METLKDRVYNTIPTTQEDIQERIVAVCRDLTPKHFRPLVARYILVVTLPVFPPLRCSSLSNIAFRAPCHIKLESRASNFLTACLLCLFGMVGVRVNQASRCLLIDSCVDRTMTDAEGYSPPQVNSGRREGARVFFQDESAGADDVLFEVLAPVQLGDVEVERLAVPRVQPGQQVCHVVVREPPLVRREELQTRDGALHPSVVHSHGLEFLHIETLVLDVHKSTGPPPGTAITIARDSNLAREADTLFSKHGIRELQSWQYLQHISDQLTLNSPAEHRAAERADTEG
ncbi:hypothetical protein PR048_011980 [Dryococelus australis]|uniref:Uncharacterized protein n=1 Tax=Dryococelus australis TaxID=614101 RepID=A0ABQ9HN21_9NEOP|nr:hypothetical protein PR048_011980 [Dryococelus australis]